MIRELLGSLYHPEMEVPESLVHRTLATLSEPEVLPAKRPPPVSQLVASGVLGFLTAFLAILASGSAGAGGPALPLILSLLVGAVAVAVRGRASWEEEVAGATGA